jgi:GH24 family phage-related lysozyme (muramidase)
MKTSQEGIDLIKSSESFVDHLYNDQAGHCTVGYGYLVHKGPCCGAPTEAPFEQGISEITAQQLLMIEVDRCEDSVRKLVKVPIDQSEFDALVDFEYNLGIGSLRDSTLLKKLNAGDYAGAAEEFKRWIYADHKKLSGLAVRRDKEVALFNRDLPREDVQQA